MEEKFIKKVYSGQKARFPKNSRACCGLLHSLAAAVHDWLSLAESTSIAHTKESAHLRVCVIKP